MKLFIVLTVVALASCDKFDEDEIMKAQNQLIKDTIAKLQAMASSNKTGTFLDKVIGAVKGPVEVMKLLNDNLENMDKMMMAEGDKQEKNGYPLMKKWFKNIHSVVYEWGRKTALTIDWPLYLAKNSTDGKLALAKFAATAVVINWRCELDQERRTVHPTTCKDEQGGWADWKVETDKVVNDLKDLIPKLEEAKSAYWAHEHQRMLDYIKEGITKINADIKAEPSEEKRAKYLCLLVENLHLLNVVASSRQPTQ